MNLKELEPQASGIHPVELVSPASCSLGADRGGKGPSSQGEWGRAVNIRYLIHLGAGGEEEEGDLSKTVHLNFFLSIASP